MINVKDVLKMIAESAGITISFMRIIVATQFVMKLKANIIILKKELSIVKVR